MPRDIAIPIEALNPEAFAPFGTVLGRFSPASAPGPAHSNPMSDFWSEHVFEPGAGGACEVVWVNYRNATGLLRTLEAHWLTQQAIIPLGGGEIIHVVCPGRAEEPRLPDLARIRAFRIGDGMGICMNPGCWHASFVAGGQTTCLMLTRASTTRDLVAHLDGKGPAAETTIVEIDALFDGHIRLADAAH